MTDFIGNMPTEPTPIFMQMANFVMNDGHLEEVALTLGKHQKELPLVQDNIRRLREELYAAKNRRDELKTSIARCKRLLKASPARKLPQEILTEIFRLYFDDTVVDIDVHDIRYWRNVIKTQVVLQCVCRRWADGVKPVAYQKMIPIFPQPAADHWEHLGKDINGLAAHSKLSVVFVPAESVKDQQFEALDACGARLSTLVVPPNAVPDDRAQFRLAEMQRATLERVWLAGTHKEFISWLTHNLPLFRKLKYLSIEEDVGPGSSIVTMVSKSIRQLHLQSVECDTLLSTLEGMPQLLHLRVETVYNCGGTKTVTHPNLKSFISRPNRSSEKFLVKCTFPGLVHLDIHVHNNSGKWPSPEDAKFFKRCSSLEYFCIAGYTKLSSSALTEVLYSVPTLRTVSLCTVAVQHNSNIIPSSFLISLAAKGEACRRRPIPPHIVDFGFPDIRDGQRQMFHQAVDGILARRDEYAALKCLRMDLADQSAIQQAVIGKLAAAGISIKEPILPGAVSFEVS